MRAARRAPGSRAYRAAVAFVQGELPELLEGLDVRPRPRRRPFADPRGVGLFEPGPPGLPAAITILDAGPPEHLVATLAHEALHACQWRAARSPRAWRASAAQEREAEEFALILAEAYRRRR
jgi:hypothetical protein